MSLKVRGASQSEKKGLLPQRLLPLPILRTGRPPIRVRGWTDLKFENGPPSHFENGLPSIRLAVVIFGAECPRRQGESPILKTTIA